MLREIANVVRQRKTISIGIDGCVNYRLVYTMGDGRFAECPQLNEDVVEAPLGFEKGVPVDVGQRLLQFGQLRRGVAPTANRIALVVRRTLRNRQAAGDVHLLRDAQFNRDPCAPTLGTRWPI
jgi:hypothetical protein